MIFVLSICLVPSYSTYGQPSEFGNLTATTCYLGGDLGELNCSGDALITGTITTPSNIILQNSGIMNTNWVQFNTSYADGQAEGRMQWNILDGTPEIGMPGGNVNLQIGQEMLVRVKNAEGEIIRNCQAVFVSGASGSRPEVSTPIASNLSEAPLTIGLATEELAVNTNGFINTFGLVRGCDTSAWSAGDILYLSPSEEGNMTNVRPTPPNMSVILGEVLFSNVNEGVIGNRPVVVQRVGLSSDVYLPGRSNNSVLAWDATNQRYGHTNSPIFNNLTLNGGWESGGVSIIDGDIYAQTGYFYNLTSLNITEQNLTIIDNLNVEGDYLHQGSVGFTGSCVNITYSGGIAISCND